MVRLLKSHTHPNPDPSLAGLFRFPACLLSPRSRSLSRAGPGHPGLRAQNPPDCPNSPRGCLAGPPWERFSAEQENDSLGSGSVDLRGEERFSATVPAPHPQARRDGWEASSAPRKKEGEGRAGRVVVARKRTRAPAPRSWGGCPGDAPPQGAAMSPEPPGAQQPQELGPEPRNGGAARTTGRNVGPSPAER